MFLAKYIIKLMKGQILNINSEVYAKQTTIPDFKKAVPSLLNVYSKVILN